MLAPLLTFKTRASHQHTPTRPSLSQKKKTLWNVPSTDVIAVTRKIRKTPQKNKNSQAALLGLKRCQHSKLSARFVATSVLRRTPRTGQAQRAEILPFRNARGRFLSQRGRVVQHHQLRPNWKERYQRINSVCSRYASLCDFQV